MRISWFDRIILGGRDPYRPTILLRTIRLQYAWAASLMVIIAFVGFLWWSTQDQARRACLQRNQQALVSRQVLEQLAEANRADGNVNSERVWRQWAELAARSPLPRC